MNNEEGIEVSMSIEETSALRIKLGLKPLDPGKGSSKDKQAAQNYEQARLAERDKDAKAKALDSIEKSKNRRKLRQKLEGATLGDASEDVDDTLAWIKRRKQKREELVKQKERELQELDEEAIKDYTASDLSGLRVGHGLEDFVEGGERILVLKDSTIEENEEEGDELQSIAVTDSEKLRKNLESKRKNKAYTGLDDDEINSGQKKNILSQYDEVESTSGFIISAEGNVNIVDEQTRRNQIANKLKANSISLEQDKLREIKDYYTAEEMAATFKKPKEKKKKSKTRKRAEVDEELETRISEATSITETDGHIKKEEDGMDIDTISSTFVYSNRDVNIDGTNFVDDDDLQRALAHARRSNIKNKPKVTEEEIAKMAREAEELETQQKADSLAAGMILSDTSEFVRTLSTAPAFQPVIKREVQVKREHTETAISEARPRQGSVNIDMQDATSTAGRDTEEIDVDEREEGEVEDLLEEFDEPLVGSSLAATVAFLSQKGLVRKADKVQLEKELKERQRQQWLNEAHRRQLKEEVEKLRKRAAQQGKDKGKSRGGGDGYYDEEEEYRRERESKAEERHKLREIEDRFKDYKPVVDIKYFDEFGRVQTAKEAFKTLSHQFHGKKPGKEKTEKKLSKIAQELREKAMPASDTPLGTATALLDRQQQTGSAYITLAVGNRAVMPSADVSLTKKENGKPQQTKKGKINSSSRKTIYSSPVVVGSGWVETDSGINNVSISNSVDRIGPVLAVNGGSSITPIKQGREKVAFGLGKRKTTAADAEDGNGGNNEGLSPAKKMRQD